ncbi:hypothetical protein KAJ27_18845, partial [bacterium]|nr:hypothetical protein [bacterium]
AVKIIKNSSNRSREIEEKMFKSSLALEKVIAKKHLEEISESFPEEVIIQDGVRYNRIEREKEVHLGRVSVPWIRPIYEGSIKGKTVYIYPADNLLSPPSKGHVSYETLSLSSLLGTFIPFKIVAYMLSVIRGVKISETSVQRYTESTGQFAIENLEEIIESKRKDVVLGKNEILIASIDGSSSMINGNNRRSNKGKKTKDKRRHSSKKKSQEDLLRSVIF